MGPNGRAKKGGGRSRPLERDFKVDRVPVVACLVAPCNRADFPDHAGARDLDERSVTGDLELGIRVRLAEVPYCAVVRDIGAAVGTEPDVRRTVEAAKVVRVHERLLERDVVSKPLDLEFERIARFAEVDELDLVAHLRAGRGGIGLREPEVPLEGVHCRPALDWPRDRKSTRLNSSHDQISYAVFCL